MSVIEVDKVVKTYISDGVDTTALGGVSLSIEEGEFAAIMGPSGSGKSTLLHILGFLDRPTSGSYRFDGKEISDYTDEELASIRNGKMGFIFQSFQLLPRMSVLDNVKLPLLYSGIKEDHWDKMAKKAVHGVGLDHRIDHDASKLSGGEKQRVAIARALVNGPRVVFADEPTGNLDSKSGKGVMDIIQKLNEDEGITIVLITHETYTAEHAERIIRVKDGLIESDEKVTHRRHSVDEFLK